MAANGEAPSPAGATTVEHLTERLRLLQAWSGMSYRAIHRELARDRVARGVPERPVLNTVYRCFQPGRSRLDVELVVDIARLLLGDDDAAEQWRHGCLLVASTAAAAAIVGVAGTWPDDLPAFTGRQDDLRRVLAPDAALGWVIAGMPGVGKTRLAVHAGHRLMADGRFDDVRLAVDLRGYDPDRPPADPSAVLEGFLRKLGVPGDRVQHLGLAGRADRFRELLAGRTALLLLDNAASAEQVAPLLPGTSGSFALITSRRRLPDLPSVRSLTLDVLAADEAVELLRRASGDAVDADLGTAAEIAGLLGHLPLALDLLTGRMRANPDWALSDHLDRLLHHRRGLRLDTGVEVAISLSYRDLPAAPRRTFRLLALHPGSDLTPPAVAALTGTDPDQARGELDQLAAAHLLQQPVPGRYRFHDLIRTYATSRAHDEDPAGARRAALTRLVGHYLHTTGLAVDLLYPHERDRRPRIPDQRVPPAPLADPAAARAWLDVERTDLLAVATQPDQDGALLAAVLHRHLAVTGGYTDARLLHEHVIARAGRRGDTAAEARALLDLGEIDVRTGRYDLAIDHVRDALALPDGLAGPLPVARALRYLAMANQFTGHYDRAIDHLEQAVEVSRRAGDRPGEASGLGNLGVVHQLTGRYAEAADHHRRALVVFDALGALEDKARALNHLGTLARLLGRYSEAAEHHRRALDLFTDVRALEGQASAHDHLGVVERLTGRLHQAHDHHRRALELSRRIGDRDDEARALDNLGDLHRTAGRFDLAVEHHELALALYRDLGDPGGQAAALNGLGETALATGSPRAALTAHAEACACAGEIGHQQEQARACDGLAHAHHVLGDHDQARERWRQALSLYERLGVAEADTVRARLRDR
ncbi:ATP-binding protein [Umezawaea sp.]|uniref:ATP-binding protein n=1 Tax=Umezawaea sp. TaxID=1955258 RepID=UPI002ED61534